MLHVPCFADNDPGVPVYFVYSCGDGNILQHDPWKLDKPAVDLNKIISRKNDMRVRHNLLLRLLLPPTCRGQNVLSIPSVLKLLWIKVRKEKTVNICSGFSVQFSNILDDHNNIFRTSSPEVRSAGNQISQSLHSVMKMGECYFFSGSCTATEQ